MSDSAHRKLVLLFFHRKTHTQTQRASQCKNHFSCTRSLKTAQRTCTAGRVHLLWVKAFLPRKKNTTQRKIGLSLGRGSVRFQKRTPVKAKTREKEGGWK